MVKKKRLKLMVSSTVYNAVSDLDQIKAVLEAYGYHVIMSKEGTVRVDVDDSPEEACLKAVEECDLFLGIIFPRYGSGITHKEFHRAVKLDKPRWFLSHIHIEFTRKLLHQFMMSSGKRNSFDIEPCSVLDSVKVVDMYSLVRSKWVQSFYKTSELLKFIETQFQDYTKLENSLKARNHG